MNEKTSKKLIFPKCRADGGCKNFHLNEYYIYVCKLGFDTWSGQCGHFAKKEKSKNTSTCYWCTKEYDHGKGEGYSGGGMYYRGMDYICNECLMSKKWQGIAGLENTYRYHINKIEKEKMNGGKKMTIENVNINSKERVSKIMEKRQNYIEKVGNLVKSDKLITEGNGSGLRGEFLGWLIDYKIIAESTSKKVERQPETRQERKEAKNGKFFFEIEENYTPEYRILKNVIFYHEGIRFGWRVNVIKDTDMIKLNSSEWQMAKKVLDLVVPQIPIYIEEHYRNELNRLCPLKENIVCEHCGTKNDTCNQFCGECGRKL